MTFSARLSLFFKGVAMGGADVVPGVSGGTIAFITGIYEELLETLSGLNLGLLKTLRKDGFGAFWSKLNGGFLLTLFAGIFASLISLAIGVEYVLEHHPILLWSFFFGLIVASVWLMGKQVAKWDLAAILSLIIGSVVAYFITTITPTSGSETWWYILISGSVAITAMILPGISGSFILLLMGMYTTILGALSDSVKTATAGAWTELAVSGKIIILFMIGCLAGLILFSKALNWLYKSYRNVTIAVLTGFLIGSLNKIYPWKNVLETFTKHPGTDKEEVIPIVVENVSPFIYEELGKGDHLLGLSIVCALLGVVVIVVLDRFSSKEKAVITDRSLR
ncbi:MAG: DUF368 domain-containing protein [Flavobacteriales bacterium]|jgi:putative membrane protein